METRTDGMSDAIYYLGIDVAGAQNTWIAILSCDKQDNLSVAAQPRRATLREIKTIADDSHVVAAVVDAQLTASIDDETGFRSSDRELRSILPDECKNWVASINSMMAVPVRGQLIAEALGTAVGTVVETHPRACLYFAFAGRHLRDACQAYKSNTPEAIEILWNEWVARFDIAFDDVTQTDGALDALVCATIGWLLHRHPWSLRKLGHDQPDRVGRGPFYVLEQHILTADSVEQ